jgi:arabinofuranosyltransferase
LNDGGSGVRSRALRLIAPLRAPRNLVCLVGLLVLMGLAVRHCRMFESDVIDDAFITFRYADNVAHGRGFVYNPGEHVEGTSTFLETLVLAFLRVFGANMVVASQVIGVASFMGLIVGTFALVKRSAQSHGRILGLGAAAMVASSMSLSLYAMAGLETTLFAVLILLGIYLHLEAARSPNVGPKAWSLVLGAVAITRPEGIGYFVLLLALAVGRDVVMKREARFVARHAAVSVMWFAALYVPVLAFRGIYFHALVPNTITAKANVFGTLRGKSLADLAKFAADGAGGHHFHDYVSMIGVGAYLVPFGLLLRRTRYATCVILGTIAAAWCVDALDDGDWMPGWRLLTPAVAPLAVAIALGIGAFTFRPDQRVLRTHAVSWLIVVFVFGSAASGVYPGAWPVSPADAYLVWLGKTLATTRRADDLLATDMAGMLPYYAGTRTVDMNGLCDRYIALHGQPLGPMGKIDRAYVIGRRPTLILTNFTGEMKALYNDPAFAPMRGDYFAVLTRQYRKDAHVRDRKLLAVRKDRPGVHELAASLDADLVDLGQQLKAER